MPIVGTKFFHQKEEQTIKVTNLKDVTENLRYYELLIGLTISKVKTTWQEYYEKDDAGNIIPIGGPINDRKFYLIFPNDVIPLLENENRDSSLWKKLPPETEAYLTTTCAEIVS